MIPVQSTTLDVYIYYDGKCGLQQDHEKANELWLRAGELGNAMAYQNIADVYSRGEGVEKDMKKAKHCWELSAMGGDVAARYSLGILDVRVSGRGVDRDVKKAIFF